MIGTSGPEFLFIRTSIAAIRLVTPLSIAYCVLLPLFPLSKPALVLGIYPLAETVFWLFGFLPLRHLSQRKAVHPSRLPKEARQALAIKCADSIQNPEQYLEKWFKDAPLAEIKRENLKQFFAWAFLNGESASADDEQELDGYVDAIEARLGRELEPGWGRAECIRLTLDPAGILHRPLLWYMIVGLVDTFACARLFWSGFRLYRPPVSLRPRTFPFRPQTLLSCRKSPVPNLSYWYAPHTARRRLPILFLHGIGIGLDTYVPFFADLRSTSGAAGDGEVGVVAVELLSISFRITDTILSKDEMCAQIRQILLRHGFEKVMVVSHSYGTVITTHLLKHPELSQMVESVVLVDPVSILLHLPDVAYNFTHRKPRRANEHQLYYFASTDLGVAHTLARRFFWSENILWKEDLGDRPLLVSLAGEDVIVNTPEVARYLTEGMGAPMEHVHELTGYRRGVWAKEGLRVVWHEQMDHANVFATRGARLALVDDILNL